MEGTEKVKYKKYFTFSFDDGLEQDKEIIRILKEYGMQATFNLNPGLFGLKQKIGRIGDMGLLEMPDKNSIKAKLFHAANHYRIPEDEIEQVYQGFEVACHGYAHENLAKLDSKGQEKSIGPCLEKLQQITGYPIVGHAYAFGGMNEEAAACLSKHGIIYGRGVQSSNMFTFPDNPLLYNPTNWMIDKNLFENADKFLAAEPTEGDMLFYVWGHGYEFDFVTEGSSWNRFKRFCEKIAGKEDIVYCNNKEAFFSVKDVCKAVYSN